MVEDTWMYSTLSLIFLPLILPFLAIAALLTLIFGKRFSASMASVFVPKVMASIDCSFELVREELLKGIYGTILDVGCGDGPYMKYVFR